MALTSLYGTYLQDTYQRITQVSKSNSTPDKWVVADGLGNAVTWLNVTASYSVSSSYALTASYAMNGGGGGTGTPGGSDKQIQFNDSSNFGGSAKFTFDKTNAIVTLTGSAVFGSISTPTPVAGGLYFDGTDFYLGFP